MGIHYLHLVRKRPVQAAPGRSHPRVNAHLIPAGGSGGAGLLQPPAVQRRAGGLLSAGSARLGAQLSASCSTCTTAGAPRNW
jgi:hypothetical protein